ncbi:hypothetical protein [Methylobacterium sp. R2-1]|uniref:hypothetical protein n=1 Tax=Methylobacterium sp. R2-1 TaxID=2587064 RepID=UPI0017EF0C57|nr:hypothetical protein [Methylobacterium sp. R2-1]MBB2961150.1 hypothetical protein [Methylobacterium sp. R2-1]
MKTTSTKMMMVAGLALAAMTGGVASADARGFGHGGFRHGASTAASITMEASATGGSVTGTLGLAGSATIGASITVASASASGASAGTILPEITIPPPITVIAAQSSALCLAATNASAADRNPAAGSSDLRQKNGRRCTFGGG